MHYPCVMYIRVSQSMMTEIANLAQDREQTLSDVGRAMIARGLAVTRAREQKRRKREAPYRMSLDTTTLEYRNRGDAELGRE